MKVCITEHVAPGFGVVPEGSLWDDDSPYIGADNVHLFADASAKPKRRGRSFDVAGEG